MLIDGADLVVRIAGGAEQFRRPIGTVTVLEIAGSAGDDVVSILNSGGVVSTPVLFSGGQGDDQFDASQATGPATLLGGSGADTLTGSTADDLIIGGAGPDTVNGGAGNDLIFGRSGRDSLVGNSGNDAIFGGGDRDTIEGGQDADTLGGGGGPDTIQGNDGSDLLRGGGGQDLIDGNDGADILAGGGGADNLAGGLGNDTLNGVFRDDAFNQLVGQDTQFGGNRPAERPAPVSAPPTSKEETPLFLTPKTNSDQDTAIEQLDTVFTEPLLPELLEL